MKKFRGVMPALITPLNADETINVPTLRKLIGGLLNEGADGFYIGGATGEGISLPREQREILAEESIKAIGGKKPAIVHIASTDYKEAIALAKHAQQVDADAVSAIPPLFFKYDEDDVYNYYKGLADAVSIPLIIYYNPNAGFHVNAEFAARMFEIDNVTGIKWTSSDYYGVNVLKELTHGEMNIINGPDEMLLMGLTAGADGGIGSTYNFMLPTIKRIYDNFLSGNIAEAQKAQTEADRIIRVLLKYMVIPGCKVILERQGYDVGNCVFPMKRYTEEEKKVMIEEFVKAGLSFDKR